MGYVRFAETDAFWGGSVGFAIVVEAARARAERSAVKNFIVVVGMSVRGGRSGVE
jgi:hypothetical protein